MIKITADSTCDLSPDILNSFDITLTPLHVLIDDADYRDGINIAPQDIFEYVGKQNKTCTTAAINTFEYEDFFHSLRTTMKQSFILILVLNFLRVIKMRS